MCVCVCVSIRGVVVQDFSRLVDFKSTLEGFGGRRGVGLTGGFWGGQVGVGMKRWVLRVSLCFASF